jgi:hypothetical protein
MTNSRYANRETLRVKTYDNPVPRAEKSVKVKRPFRKEVDLW